MNGSEHPKDDEYKIDGKYMIRRKFYVPESEKNRDYGRHEKLPADNILPCDYDSEDNSLDES